MYSHSGTAHFDGKRRGGLGSNALGGLGGDDGVPFLSGANTLDRFFVLSPLLDWRKCCTMILDQILPGGNRVRRLPVPRIQSVAPAMVNRWITTMCEERPDRT